MAISAKNLELVMVLNKEQDAVIQERSKIHNAVLLSDDDSEKKELRKLEEAIMEKYAAINSKIRLIMSDPVASKKEKTDEVPAFLD